MLHSLYHQTRRICSRTEQQTLPVHPMMITARCWHLSTLSTDIVSLASKVGTEQHHSCDTNIIVTLDWVSHRLSITRSESIKVHRYWSVLHRANELEVSRSHVMVRSLHYCASVALLTIVTDSTHDSADTVPRGSTLT
jgi:hypothetical protein